MKRLFLGELFKFRKSKKNWLLLAVCIVYAFGIGFSFEAKDKSYFRDQARDFEYDYMMTNEEAKAARSQYNFLIDQGVEGEELERAKTLDELWFNINDSNRAIQLAYFLLAEYPGSETDPTEYLYRDRANRMQAMMDAKDNGIIINSISFRNSSVDDFKSELQLSKHMDEYTRSLREQNLKTYDSPYYMSGLNFLAKVVSGAGAILFAVCILLTQENYSLEMSSGTYKTSMSIPATRKQIIFSKLLSSLTTGFLFIIVSIGLPFLFFSIKNGLGDLNYPYWISDGIIKTTLPYLLNEYGIYLSYILFLISSTLLLSVLLQSLATTYIVKVSEIIGSVVLLNLLSSFFPWISYLPLFHIQPILALQLLGDTSTTLVILISILLSLLCLGISIIRFEHLDLLQKED